MLSTGRPSLPSLTVSTGGLPLIGHGPHNHVFMHHIRSLTFYSIRQLLKVIQLDHEPVCQNEPTVTAAHV